MSNLAERALGESHLRVIGMEQAVMVRAPRLSSEDCMTPESLLSQYVEFASDHAGQKIVKGFISVGALLDIANASPSSRDASVSLRVIRYELHGDERLRPFGVGDCEGSTQMHIFRVMAAVNAGGGAFRSWASRHYAKQVDDLRRLMTSRRNDELRSSRDWRVPGSTLQASDCQLQLQP